MSSTNEQLQARRMNRIYRVQKYFYDWTRPLFLPGRDELLRGLNVSHGGSVLEVGCGTGRNLVRLAARLDPSVHLTGVDLSTEMLSVARRRPEKIEWLECAAENLPMDRPYDAVFFSYSLSMMPSWKAALARAFAVLKPGGSLHVVDFGDLAAWPGPVRTGLARWLDLFGVRHDPELIPELRSLATASGRHYSEQWLHGRYAFIARVMPI